MSVIQRSRAAENGFELALRQTGLRCLPARLRHVPRTDACNLLAARHPYVARFRHAPLCRGARRRVLLLDAAVGSVVRCRRGCSSSTIPANQNVNHPSAVVVIAGFSIPADAVPTLARRVLGTKATYTSRSAANRPRGKSKASSSRTHGTKQEPTVRIRTRTHRQRTRRHERARGWRATTARWRRGATPVTTSPARPRSSTG